MPPPVVGLLHPGEMGSSVGAAARAGGADVVWASEGRGPATRARAEGDGLRDVGTLDALVSGSDVIVCVCPPASAPDVARAVAARGFAGTYVDANAVAPETARAIGRSVEAGGARFVDGGIVGPPARGGGRTWLHLSGPQAGDVAALFAAGPIEVVVMDAPAGAASALKMAFAGWTKGSSALLLAIRDLARAEGVEHALLAQWSHTHSDLAARAEATARGTAPKAWRFVGEMEEIAATFAAAGLPDGFHRAAAAVYAGIAGRGEGTAGLRSGSMAAGSLEAIFAALEENGVRYLVVGGVAVVLHGHPRFTADLDLVVALDAENVRATLAALGRLGYAPRAPVTAGDLADPARRADWARNKGMTVSMASPTHPTTEVDLFVEESFPFEDAYHRAVRADLGSVTVSLASIGDLVEMKRRAGRPQDLEDARNLEAIARELGESG